MSTKRFNIVTGDSRIFCGKTIEKGTIFGVFEKIPYICDSPTTGRIMVLTGDAWHPANGKIFLALREFVSELIVRNRLERTIVCPTCVLPKERKPTAYDARHINRNAFALRSWTAENYNAVMAPSMPHTVSSSGPKYETVKAEEANKKARIAIRAPHYYMLHVGNEEHKYANKSSALAAYDEACTHYPNQRIVLNEVGNGANTIARQN